MKKAIYTFFILFITFLFVPIVKADTGPKPYATYTFKGLEKSDYLVAMLYNSEYCGPHTSYEKCLEQDKSYFGSMENLKLVYEAIEIPSGFYLMDICSRYNECDSFVFKTGYWYPTKNYCIAVVDAVNKTYAISEKIENNYAFNCEYFFDFSGKLEGSFILEWSEARFITLSIVDVIIRLVVTLAIEMLIALVFRFDKKSMLIILITNVLTQLLLNVLMSINYTKMGINFMMFGFYFVFEIVIFLIEAGIYYKFCKGKYSKKWFILYALLANALSFFASFGIWIIQDHIR